MTTTIAQPRQAEAPESEIWWDEENALLAMTVYHVGRTVPKSQRFKNWTKHYLKNKIDPKHDKLMNDLDAVLFFELERSINVIRGKVKGPYGNNLITRIEVYQNQNKGGTIPEPKGGNLKLMYLRVYADGTFEPQVSEEVDFTPEQIEFMQNIMTCWAREIQNARR